MIPVIEVRSLVAKRIYEGTLDFEFDPEEGLLDIPFVEFSSPVHAKLGYQIFEDDSLEIKGSISFHLKGACSRCLAPAERCVIQEVDAVFEVGKGDGVTYGYQNVVKLDELLHDTLLFAFPSRFLCGNCGDPDGE